MNRGGFWPGTLFMDIILKNFIIISWQGMKTLLGFLDELQITDKLIWLPSSVGYLIDRTIYKLDTPTDILKFPALNFWTK